MAWGRRSKLVFLGSAVSVGAASPAMYALGAFCREVNDIADAAVSCFTEETLLLNWRNEIAHLYASRPRRAVTRGLNHAVRFCGLRCDDFLAIIDGAEMVARTEFRAPSLAQLDRHCECVELR